MPSATFIVPGDPVPHVSVTHRSKFHPDNKRAKKVAAWKETVRKCAMVARVRIPIPSREQPVTIKTMAYFRNGRHGDPENIHKGCKDALWPAKEGGDKYTGGAYSAPLYDPQNPRVVVYLEWGENP